METGTKLKWTKRRYESISKVKCESKEAWVQSVYSI